MTGFNTIFDNMVVAYYFWATLYIDPASRSNSICQTVGNISVKYSANIY